VLNIPIRQRTIRHEISIHGAGVHTGAPCSIRILPAKENSGVVFVTGHGIVSADPFKVKSESSTVLQDGNARVSTVEHLLSCLYGLFIDNVEVEVYGEEVPIGNGSARRFYRVLTEAGIVEQKSLRNRISITKIYEVIEGKNRFVRITPSDYLRLNFAITWHPTIRGCHSYTHGIDSYEEIAIARTFAEKEYVESLQKDGLAQGAKPGINYIELRKDGTHSQLNTPSECVKHKILDLLGDLSLMYGLYINGEVTSVNGGHRLNHKLIQQIV